MQSAEERFWAKVDRRGPDDCWLWLGARHKKGYGMVYFDGRTQGAHRVAYALAIGPIPAGLGVLHHCDNPPCVNPGAGHLFTGTPADNNADMRSKGRHIVSRTKPARTPFSNFKLDFTPMKRRLGWLGMTQKQLALAVGVHAITMHKTLNNKSEPTFSQMLAASRALGVPIHLLFDVVELDGR